jgi:radical SAM-linked protein
VSEVRQRWRVVFARDKEARYLSHLDAVRLWERAFRRGGIPIAASGGFSPRPRLVFAAPLQLGMLAEHELADVFVVDRLTASDLRDRLTAALPSGYRLVDLYDVWVGAPAIAPQLVAADYRLTLLNVEAADIERAAARLLAAEALPRYRRREARSTPYDLRPLLFDLRVGPADPEAVLPGLAPVPATGLWLRLRHSQHAGAGRVEEVVAALADELGLAADVIPIENEEVVAGDVPVASGADLALTRPAPGAAGSQSRRVEAPARRSPAVRPVSARPTIELVRPVRERLWLASESFV